MITDSKLRRLIAYVYEEFLVDNVNVDLDMCNGIQEALLELQWRRNLTKQSMDNLRNGGQDE